VRGAILDGVRQLSLLPRRSYERIVALEAAAQVSEGEAENAFANGPFTDRAAAHEALHEHLCSVALAASMGLATETQGGSDADSPEEAFARAELIQIIRGALTGLDAPEQNIVRRHYLEGERFEDIALAFGMSKSWVSRLHTRAIEKLARRLRGVGD
jgi:RNA polymerase sigma factor for flagellar operon FliA